MAKRLKVADLLPEPIELEVADGIVYTIDQLGVDDVMRMFVLEEAMTGDDLSPAEQMNALAESRNLIVDIARRSDPDAFKDGAPNWPPQVVMAILASLSGNDSVAEAVRETHSGTPEEIAERMAAEAMERAEAEARGEAAPEESAVPLDSESSSQTPSSSSDESTAGDRSGGAIAAGTPTAATSDTREPAAV